MICIDDIPEKTEQIALQASGIFDVQIQRNLTLITIRHYTKEYRELFSKAEIILEQRTGDTLQLLIKEDQSTT
jgi:aspartate kinase